MSVSLQVGVAVCELGLTGGDIYLIYFTELTFFSEDGSGEGVFVLHFRTLC